MGQEVSEIGRRAVALAVVAAAAWVLLKLVIGVIATVAWAGVALVALVGVVWALRKL